MVRAYNPARGALCKAWRTAERCGSALFYGWRCVCLGTRSSLASPRSRSIM